MWWRHHHDQWQEPIEYEWKSGPSVSNYAGKTLVYALWALQYLHSAFLMNSPELDISVMHILRQCNAVYLKWWIPLTNSQWCIALIVLFVVSLPLASCWKSNRICCNLRRHDTYVTSLRWTTLYTYKRFHFKDSTSQVQFDDDAWHRNGKPREIYFRMNDTHL